MTNTGYYTHMDERRYRCEVVEETETMARVRLTEETAKELRLPKRAVKVDGR